MICIGYDIGTRFIKTCIVENEKILGTSIKEVGRRIRDTIEETLQSALDMAGIKKKKIKKVAVTGYGDNIIKKADYHVKIDTCLAKTSFRLNKEVRTIIDTGNLFIHVVTISEKGFLEDSCENEVCAAGSGKFLELISGSVGIPIESISESALQSGNPYTLASKCAVFAESEVITQVNAGTDSSDIISGIIYSIASRINTMLRRVDAKDKIAITGGVSNIEAFQIILEKVLGREIISLPIDFQIAAAYGAALFAVDRTFKKKGR